mgnify:CR=1 FL=1
MTKDDISAGIDAAGNINMHDLDATQLSLVVLTKLTAIEKQLASIDDRLATKDDVRVVSERVDRLEVTVERNDEWIKARAVRLDDERDSLGARLKNKAAEYIVTGVIALIVTGIVGGVMYYIGQSSAASNVQDEIRAIKELAP